VLIPVQGSESWEERNGEIHNELKLPETTTVKVHPGIIPALREITLGLSQLFPHKMTIAYQPKVAFYIDECLKTFSRQGYKTLPLDGNEPPKDTLAVIIANDHPVTAELYNNTILTHGLSEKKVFIIRLSHNEHFFREPPKSISPYEVTVFDNNESAISIAGERAKFTAYISPNLNWKQKIELPFNTKKERENEVKGFEKNLPKGANLFFAKEVPRLYDRSLIYWKDIDGLAIVSEMHEPLGERLDTLSICRWGNAQAFRPYLPDVSDEALRGTVIISSEIINEKLKEKFETVTQKVLQIQNG
jgi:hypothetical protein